jgi:hypothetical protein
MTTIKPIVWFLALTLALPSAKTQTPQTPEKISLILSYEGPFDIGGQRIGRVIARAEDQNRRPVAGVAISITLPSRGASGAFTGTGDRIAALVTGPDGSAKAEFAFNGPGGTMEIRARANNAQRQTLTIENPRPPVLVEKAIGMSLAVKIVAAFAVAAAAVATPIVIRNQQESTPQRPEPTVITRGAVRIP